MGVNSLPKTVTRQHRECDLNPGPSAPQSSTLTTRLPSHHCLKPGNNRDVRNVPLAYSEHISPENDYAASDYSVHFVILHSNRKQINHKVVWLHIQGVVGLSIKHVKRGLLLSLPVNFF